MLKVVNLTEEQSVIPWYLLYILQSKTRRCAELWLSFDEARLVAR